MAAALLSKQLAGSEPSRAALDGWDLPKIPVAAVVTDRPGTAMAPGR